MPCPPDDTLTGYLNDSLPAAEAARLSLHVDACDHCQTSLERLTSGSRVVERYQQAGSVIRAPMPPSGSGPPPGGANQTQMLGSEGIPLVPRIEPVRPELSGYQIKEEIGRGGMGVVYRAEQRRLNRPVALKLILAGGLADPRVTQRFLFEGEVLARVKHPQVVEVYEVGMHTAPTGVSLPYLAMELLDHGTLHGWAGDGKKSPREAAELVEGLARAVHAAHQQGVIHRDLKPANILRGADGRFKVSDFGLAKLVQESSVNLTGTGTVVGTPAYMAPEQAAGNKLIGPPADVYSLGAMLFELLTGRPPFPGQDGLAVMLRVLHEPAPSVRSVRADVPRDLTAVIDKCLAKEPHRRYPSADQLAEDLKRFREDRPTRARPHTATERVRMWAKRNPAVASLLGCLGAVMATAFISAVVLWQRAENTAADMKRARDDATRLAKVANAERDEAAKQRKGADRHAAYLAFDQAVGQCEDGQIGEGLRGFVRALELAERTDDAELARVIRVNVTAWERELLPAGPRFRHTPDGVVRATAFSPDGKWVLTGWKDGTVRVWEADTGRRVAEFAAQGGPPDVFEQLAGEVARVPGVNFETPTLRAVAASPDAKRVAAVTSSGTVLLWDVPAAPPPAPLKPKFRVRTNTSLARFPDLWAVRYAPDGSLWVGGDYGVLDHLDADGKFLHALTVPDGLPREPDGKPDPSERGVQTLALSPDGTRLFSGDRSGRVIEWDVAEKAEKWTFQVGGWLTAVSVSGDGNTVAATGTHGKLWVWERAGTRWRLRFSELLGGAYGHGAAISDDGQRAAATDEDGKVRVWDLRSNTPVGGLIRVGVEARKVLFRPGTQHLLLSQDDSVRVQPMPATGEVPLAVPNPLFRVRALDFRPTDGAEIIVGSGTLQRFDTATGVARASPWVTGEVLAAVYSADGERVLFGQRNGWGATAADGFTPARRFPSGWHYVNQLVGRPTDERAELFSGREFTRLSADGSKVEFTLLPDCLKRQDGGPSAQLLTPDRTELRLAVGDRIEFADARTGKATRSPVRATDAINDLAQTADGGRVYAALRDTTVQGWEVRSAEPLFATPPRHALAVTGVAVRADGGLILSGSRDHTARFWDGKTGLPLGPALRHADPVNKVALSPDGTRAATGTSTGRASVWKVPPPPDPAPVDELQKRFAGVVGAALPDASVHD